MTDIFYVNHEAGDLSEYNSTVTDGGDLSVSAAAALAGSAYGLSCLIDDTTAIYGSKTFTILTSGIYRTRLYIDPNSLTMANTDSFNPMVIADGVGQSRATLRLSYLTASGYRVSANVRIDDSSLPATGWYNITDAPHWIEILVQYATGASTNDGVLTLWVDDVQKDTITTLDLFTLTQPSTAALGAVAGLDAGTSGTFYLDEWVLNNDGRPIGAHVSVTLPALLDNANRSNEGPPPSANWTNYGTGFQVLSNQLYGSINAADSQLGGYWNTPAPIDGGVYWTHAGVTFTGNMFVHLYLRLRPSDDTGYSLVYQSVGGAWSATFWRDHWSAPTQLITPVTVPALEAGQKLYAVYSGGTLSAYYKLSAGPWMLIASVADSTYASYDVSRYIGAVARQSTSFVTFIYIFDDFGGVVGVGNPWYYYAQQ